MKKLLSLAVLACSMFLLSSCDDEGEESTYVPQPVEVSSGVFIINGGNYYSQISGSLTYIDYEALLPTQKLFNTVNGRELGGTANDAVVYGDKLYIVVTDENTVEIVDKNSITSLRQIKTEEAMGPDKGTNPRHIVAGNGKVYVSTYDGYVAQIDTVSLSVEETYQVGSYPEGMALDGDKLYVANSDWSMCINPSISCIDLTNGTYTEIRDDKIPNPVDVSVIDGVLYVLDSGTYDDYWNQVGAGVKKVVNGTVTDVVDATMMAVNGSKIYVVNNSYGASTITYSVYDTASGATSTFPMADKPYSPVAIGVDNITGNVFITSYNKDPDTGYAGYNIDGYVNIYASDGSTVKKEITTGIYPIAIAFNTSVVYE